MKYYVVYNLPHGKGSCTIETKKIKTYKDIMNIADYISKTWCDNSSVIILSWQKIK